MSVKLLIVEDESIVALDFQISLEKKGFYVKTVSSGEEALKEIEKECYNIILMDISLNDELNGIETAKIIKNKQPHVELVFISGNSDLIDHEVLSLFKPFRFISKPLDVDELEEILRIKV